MCIRDRLTGEFAEKAGACAIIRGVRNTTDFEYERTMEATNHRIYPDITTVMPVSYTHLLRAPSG